MPRAHATGRSLGFAVTAAVAAAAVHRAMAEVPTETAAKYAAFRDGYRNPNSSNPHLVNDLAAAPDGDLCFLDFVTRNGGNHDWRFLAARDQLGRLDTDRTFDRLLALLDAPASTDRAVALDALAAWHRPAAVTKLLSCLNDEAAWVRRSAISALANYKDPRIEPALLRSADRASDAFDARRVLAARQYGPAWPKVLAALDAAPPGERDSAIADIAAYRKPEAVERVLAEFRSLDAADPSQEFLRSWTQARLRESLAAVEPALGPWPDPVAAQWDDFWLRARPMLTDTLTLKPEFVPKPAATFPPEAFAVDLGRVTLAAALDRPVYRVGDPVRLDLQLTNTGASPVSTIIPRPPSGWMPTMAYGVRLTRGHTTLLDLRPSSFYEGSYGGPPPFEALGPGATSVSSVCLQDWLGGLALPLAAGDYELTLVFDSAEFASVRPTGVQRLSRWTAPPVRFTVDGPPRTDAADLLNQIAAIAGLKVLTSDLCSDNAARRDPAWRAVFLYGDARLAPFIRRLEQDGHSGPSRAADLRPVERLARPPAVP